MRLPFAHEAMLVLDPGADIAAPGAAVTMELCGHWQHEPPCPLAPHHSAAERIDGNLRVRVLFAAERQQEDEVREHIDRALAGGELTGPGGGMTRWQLVSSRRSVVLPEETEHAARLTES